MFTVHMLLPNISYIGPQLTLCAAMKWQNHALMNINWHFFASLDIQAS